jgi:nicotinamide phosphoribosyltransferase
VSIILNTDSYKYSQYNQYPPGTTAVYSYIESRGGRFDETVFFGLQMFIKQYLLKPITAADIDEAEELITEHGLPFYREGWEYILNEYGGYMPVTIRSVPEGTVVPVHNVLLTIENTDKNCWWVTSFLETALLRAIWYPTTVATNSRETKRIILEALEISGDPSTIGFKLHDFGSRGVSSKESAGIGGLAHIVNFQGTDTIEALIYAKRYYSHKGAAAYSVPAMEHSTVTSWGRARESDAYRNMINTYGTSGGIVSIVSDSYNIYEACAIFGTTLYASIINSGSKLVVRPDSGHPATVVLECLYILEQFFGSELNAKGYRVLNNVGVLQGDGINIDSIHEILDNIMAEGFSADNIVFGQGGALLQIVNRDDQKFAMKCSAALVDGAWVEVYKDPITDTGKRSKRGRVTLYFDEGRGFYSGVEDWQKDALVTNYVNGKHITDYTLESVRALAAL